ncbi:MAG TPA: PEGA domain-containing protein [Polyangiaceae bacterium]|nr:PEGA domain-containing protein [Polyangiaceae bacterium]
MSDKGGSNLDIFKDLTRNSSAPAPSGAAAAPAPGGIRQKTMLGLQPPPGAFPPAPSRTSGTIPPPLPRNSSAPGGPPPPPARTALGLTVPPPPPPSRRSGPPPPIPPALGSGLATRPNGAPPSAPSSAPRSPASARGVDMDWDDEDEKTTVYDKGGNEDAARALLATSVPPPAPPPAAGRPSTSMAPPPRMTAPPSRPMPRPSMAPMPSAPQAAIPAPAPVPAYYPGRRAANRTPYIAGAAGVFVLAVVAYFFLFPRVGSLVVTVAGPSNKPLDAVEILVNGDKRCSNSPCTLDGIKPDTYYVRAHAAGYQAMADIAVVVSAGGKAVQNLTLVRALGTGVKVLGEGTGLKLYVDGREIGPLPQEIKDMEPGDHTIRVAGSERFEAFEKKITVEPEQMQTIGPLKLRVLKGLATIQPGAGSDGARVILISGSDRRTLPKLPITLDIPTDQPHTLVATRRGYEQFKLPLTFDDGEVEKSFEVSMTETGSGAAAGASEGSGSRSSSSSASSSSGSSGTQAAASPPPVSAGSATLNVNSIPVSNVILDGRPIGATPRAGVRVSAGSHTVVFVSGTMRKVSSVSVGSGQSKTVAVRF